MKVALRASFVLGVAAICSNIGCERFEPSVEQGVALPKVKKVGFPGRQQILLEYRSGTSGWPGPRGWSGLLIADDGDVWRYSYAYPSPPDAGTAECDLATLPRHSLQASECLHRNSNLVARLDQSLMDALRADLEHLNESGRVSYGEQGRDGGYSGLERTAASALGRLIIGSCDVGLVSQLDSPEARRIIRVFRRLRRAIPDAPLPGACPDSWERRKQIAAGVTGWWTRDD
jgi:hypothetical protein